jgi:hypothetical protein
MEVDFTIHVVRSYGTTVYRVVDYFKLTLLSESQTMKLHRMTSGLTFILGSSEFLDGQITERRSEVGAGHWQRLGESLRLSGRLKPLAIRWSLEGRNGLTGAAAAGRDGCD